MLPLSCLFAFSRFSANPQRSLLTAWCELRNDFRHFDINRLGFVQMLDARYPYSRQRLLKTVASGGL
ncbi:hypothetical protein B1H58_08595 [Pantoea alhagi]|uniref:Uncharacterized protein n=1 Tax=Pantoea alhagi TaxID=1891675 RepID=A0A1W6B4U3_9GAMM|nr:hypothetical protein B1H58_08595 [Pantoea alhagi]